jgi:hypothetical protein
MSYGLLRLSPLAHTVYLFTFSNCFTVHRLLMPHVDWLVYFVQVGCLKVPGWLLRELRKGAVV